MANYTQSLADVIKGGIMEQYASRFRYCRDVLHSSQSCKEYARRKLYRDFPLASPNTIDIAVDRADRARARGTSYRRGNDAFEPGDWADMDVTDILRRKFGIGTLTYRYRVQVIAELTYADKTVQVRTYPVIIQSASALTKREILEQAEAAFQAAPAKLMAGSPPKTVPLDKIDLSKSMIQSAYRTRLYPVA